MARKRQDNLTWLDMDAADLPKSVAAQYKAYKVAQAAASKERQAFADLLNLAAHKSGSLPEGKTLLVSHVFGKLRVAIADEQATTEKAQGGKFTL